MPVHVGKWQIDGRVVYRVTGIVWADRSRLARCRFAFDPASRGLRGQLPGAGVDADVERVVTHMATRGPGRYQIVLRVDDPTIRTRRARCVFLCERGRDRRRCDPPGRSGTWGASGSWGETHETRKTTRTTFVEQEIKEAGGVFLKEHLLTPELLFGVRAFLEREPEHDLRHPHESDCELI